MELYELGIRKLTDAFAKGEASPTEALESLIKRIEALEPEVRAFLKKDFENAREAAAKADRAWAEARAGALYPAPLTGVPYALKDNMCTKGLETTCGSMILKGFVPPYDATVVEKLKGAVLLGKLNMDEFAMGSSTENSAFGASRNPWDTDRVPGGSSGGSAAAVAAGFAPFALGSDTGGSIRQPASYCGVVGLKPTYGRVSRYGLVAFGSSLDQIGPLTRSVEDAAVVFESIAGHDPKDSTSSSKPVPDVLKACGRSIRGMKIGLPKEYFAPGLSDGVKGQVTGALERLEAEGAEVVEVSLPSSMYGLAAYYLCATAEASSNLARFDGIRYGMSDRSAGDVVSVMKRTRSKGFGAEVKRRIMLGTYVLSAGYYEAYYNKALKVRRVLKDEFYAAFDRCDVIAGPTAPEVAFRFGERTDDPISMYMSDIYTITANLIGIPSISVPCGLSSGLPVGIQLAARAFDEEGLFAAAAAVERTSGLADRIAEPKGGSSR
ncbi:MAG: Asp-tRNA(Asn)/Glu-tRNA(Gln) amidotransferase subunit GatA [Firmicutes bacterium]|nr:Asp-tRNA(Asn)/Glu-tRNA(Gln) amidotransferase subunit GatA [Bacillota bacterium]